MYTLRSIEPWTFPLSFPHRVACSVGHRPSATCPGFPRLFPMNNPFTPSFRLTPFACHAGFAVHSRRSSPVEGTISGYNGNPVLRRHGLAPAGGLNGRSRVSNQHAGTGGAVDPRPQWGRLDSSRPSCRQSPAPAPGPGAAVVSVYVLPRHAALRPREQAYVQPRSSRRRAGLLRHLPDPEELLRRRALEPPALPPRLPPTPCITRIVRHAPWWQLAS